MTDDQFNALFDAIHRSAFRHEGLPVYAVDEEDADLAAWRQGLPVAERSVRTDPWLARIADQTINREVDWCRVRYAPSPLSWYLRWEIADGYVESQAVGERILLTDQRVWDGPDFWLFDAASDSAHAVLLSYDAVGAPTGLDHVTERDEVRTLIAAADALAEVAIPLNRWLVEHREELHGAGVRG